MNDKSRTGQITVARTAHAARGNELLRPASPERDASPQAVEATLASISEEVTADAIERRRDKGKLGT
jgi:hypothetical protein